MTQDVFLINCIVQLDEFNKFVMVLWIMVSCYAVLFPQLVLLLIRHLLSKMNSLYKG